MPHRKLIRRKVITNQGTAYVTVMHTDHGTEYLKRHTVDGVKRLRVSDSASTTSPALTQLKHLVTKDIDRSHLVPDPASATTGLTELVNSNHVAKMGGRIKPTRNLIMREINHALRK